MAEAFEKGGQTAWFHDHGHWGGFFHTYDRLQLSGFGEHFAAPRKIHVFIPRDYEISGDHYPVLYCNDGDRLFFADGGDGQHWQMAECLSQMYLRGELPKLIVVALCPGDRPYEYSHLPDQGGGLADYSRYLAKGIKPFIDNHYRTQKHKTLLLGASLGGLAALFTACHHPRQFPTVAALSPTLWLGLDKHPPQHTPLDHLFTPRLEHSALVATLRPTLENPALKPTIYLDWGLQTTPGDHDESPVQKRCQEMTQLLLQEFGYQENVNLFTVQDFLGQHHIESWRARVPRILQLLL